MLQTRAPSPVEVGCTRDRTPIRITRKNFKKIAMATARMKRDILAVYGDDVTPDETHLTFTKTCKGAHGSVLVCHDKTLGRKIAVKQIIPDHDIHNPKTYEGQPTYALRELAAYKRLGTHTNILHLLAVKYSTKELMMYMTFDAMTCNLRHFLRNNKLGPEQKHRFKVMIADAVEWCHTRGVMHRDIKPDNILVDEETMTLKLCDFGLARLLSKCPQRSLSLCAVTLWYRDVRLLLGETKYREYVDIWSLACVFFEIETLGKVMFYHDCNSEIGQLFAIINVLGALPASLSHLPEFNAAFLRAKRPVELEDNLLRDMLNYDANSRPSAYQVTKRLSEQSPLCPNADCNDN